MATLKTFRRFELTLDGVKHEGGSLKTAVETLSQTICFDRCFSIATGVLANGGTEIFRCSDIGDAITDVGADILTFDFLFIESDSDDVLIQLVFNEGGTNSGLESFVVIKLMEDKPFWLFSDDSFSHATDNAANVNTWEQLAASDGWRTATQLERVECYHDNTTNAIVRVFAST